MNVRRSISMVSVWLCAVAGGLLLWSAPALAQRMHAFSKSFGSEGSGEGELSRPGQIAVNETTGDVYVVDRGNERIEIFSASGAYVGQFNGSAAPTGAFLWLKTLEYGSSLPHVMHEGSVAVDNSANPLDPSKGDVYVTDEGHDAVDKFTASGAYVGQVVVLPHGGEPFPSIVPMNIAVDTTGSLWAQVRAKGFLRVGQAGSEGDIYEFNDASPSNEYVTQIVTSFPDVDGAVTGILGNIGLAFDSEGNLYVGKSQELTGAGFNVPSEFTNAGQILNQELDGEGTTGFGVDLISDDVYVDHETSVAAYDSSGSFIERFGSGEMNASEGIAVDSATGTVYTSDAAKQEIDVFTAFVAPDATTGSVSSFGETSVTVGGMVDPDGLPVTSCEFEYGTTRSYGQSAPCAQTPAQIGSGGTPVAISAELKGLERLTEYHFRLKVSNANGSNAGKDGTFFTPEPVEISEEGISDVSATGALFSATVDPEDSDTTFHFEYGTSVSYGKSLPVPDGDLGTGASGERATVRAQDLALAATYHVRIVASNALGIVYGPDETFTTQAGGGAFRLPDGRAWELVSPPSKQGASVEPMSQGAIEASEDGSAITYFASGPVEGNPGGNPSPLGPSQVLSRRDANGWSSQDIATTHNTAEVGGAEYRLFSPDLTRALVEPAGETPLALEATERTAYIRDNNNGSYVPLVTPNDVRPGTKFGEDYGIATLVGTPDLSHVIMTSEDLLTGDATGHHSLYEWSAGRLQLVNILPNGTVNEQGYLAGSGEGNYRHALSSDGSRVFWEGNGNNLYMRDTATGQTLQVSAPAPGVSLPPHPYGEATFQAASADGSKVFFRDALPLTLESTLAFDAEGGPSDLYVCEVVEEGGEPKCDLTDLSVDRNAGEDANVQENIMGASEDGSVVYFMATGKLAEGAEPGGENLYVESESGSTWSAPRLVAILSGEDPTGDSKVSPDGRYLAFMSNRSLTGYDNRDANSGHRDEEVFLYNEVTGHLACVSCDPTGARPAGIEIPVEGALPLVDQQQEYRGLWLAGSIPGWTLISRSGLNPGAFYQSRYLSDEGRLFFDSADSLVAQDTNGLEDVYEYEPAGVGGPSGCAASGTTYVGGAGGCVSLISSGTSAEESVFMDASASGDDVFFVTAARLTPQDVDTSRDLYDAHMCSTGAPCLSAPVTPPPCTSGDSCKAAPSPQPAIFGAPSSATFSGAGNVAPPGPPNATTPRKGVHKAQIHKRRKRRGKGKKRASHARKSLSARTRR